MKVARESKKGLKCVNYVCVGEIGNFEVTGFFECLGLMALAI
jgi:hypothetical protein